MKTFLLSTISNLLILPWIVSAGFQGIPGNYCRYRRPSECCDDRLDSCEVPIQGTYCYCDEFCFRGDYENNDCCPDFFDVCWGKSNHSKPAPNLPLRDDPYKIGCEKDGIQIENGETHSFNCDVCHCVNGVLTCQENECMIDEEIISIINSSPIKYQWMATNYPEFYGRTARDGLLLRTGTFNPKDLSQEMNPITLYPDLSKIPTTFDARKKTEWIGRIGKVCDQGWCGASWAFSTLSVAQDRLSILARGHGFVELSAQNLLSCAKLGQSGCEGGNIDRAWAYLRKYGVVREDCYKYSSGTTGKIPQCMIRRRDVSRLTCQHKDFFKMEPAYRISSKVEEIQWEIMNNGPVQALMTVHRDLFMYKNGIYSNSGLAKDGNKADKIATHSVRIIGWGSSRIYGSEPVDYWLVANSWGTEWGEDGYFRIKRGTNECGIESFVLAARGKIANLHYGMRRH